MSDVRVAYNNAYRMLMGICRWTSISAQFVADRVDSFTVLLRKMVNNLRVRLVKNANSLITEITWSPYFFVLQLLIIKMVQRRFYYTITKALNC